VSRPVCFMVMPFGKKDVTDRGEVDFDALWDRAFAPLLRDLGYDPIRADADLGASIIADMLIRLTASDLVVADLTQANPNVYYEVGIRHAAPKTGCVLIGAAKARPLFDLDQIRHLSYPLPPGELTDAAADAIQQALREPVRRAAAAQSPVYQLVPNYPSDLPQTDSEKFHDFVAYLTEFQAAAAAISVAPAAERRATTEKLLRDYPLTRPQSPAVILELLRVTRDQLSFDAALELIKDLPPGLARLPAVLEMEALALGKCGRVSDAIARIEQLIKLQGPDPERLGLLGGRYKDLWRDAIEAGNQQEVRRYLGKAIASYTDGMWRDLNEYYCASNLPRLLRSRGDAGDESLARQAADITRNACERARGNGKHDEWLNATLLGAAFDAGDADQAEALLVLVIDEGQARWKLKSTLSDLRISLSGQTGILAPEVRKRLAAVLRDLEKLASDAS
jgi:tetratricopeptide (TPR) repeat protein